MKFNFITKLAIGAAIIYFRLHRFTENMRARMNEQKEIINNTFLKNSTHKLKIK